VLVLGFIIGGAVLRDVNLLVILAGMMMGPIVFSWRWVLATIANVSVRRQMPASIMAGDPLTIELEFTNHRRRMTSWAVVLQDRFTRESPTNLDPPTSVEAALAKIPPGQSATTTYRCHITRRGRYRFGALRISTRFPWGLVKASQRLDCDDSLIVRPQVGRLTRHWRQWVEAQRVGATHSGPRRGLNEGDYYGIRQWHAGDSQRWIHWRTTARLNELSVRQFEEQLNADVAVILDLWSSRHPGDGELGNLEVAISLVATLVADICRKGGSRLTVALHSKQPRHWSAVASSALAGEILDELAVAEPFRGDQLPVILGEAISAANPSGRIIVISTRSGDIEGMLAASASTVGAPRQVAIHQAKWVDVASDDVAELFSLD
jgi:uncharacterized protein (DUF58 family)